VAVVSCLLQWQLHWVHPGVHEACHWGHAGAGVEIKQLWQADPHAEVQVAFRCHADQILKCVARWDVFSTWIPGHHDGAGHPYSISYCAPCCMVVGVEHHDLTEIPALTLAPWREVDSISCLLRVEAKDDACYVVRD
jgi:hypothetical protein